MIINILQRLIKINYCTSDFEGEMDHFLSYYLAEKIKREDCHVFPQQSRRTGI